MYKNVEPKKDNNINQGKNIDSVLNNPIVRRGAPNKEKTLITDNSFFDSK